MATKMSEVRCSSPCWRYVAGLQGVVERTDFRGCEWTRKKAGGLLCKRQRGEEMHGAKFTLHQLVLRSRTCIHARPSQIPAFMWNVLG